MFFPDKLTPDKRKKIRKNTLKCQTKYAKLPNKLMTKYQILRNYFRMIRYSDGEVCRRHPHSYNK